MADPSGILLINKPQGVTSHRVVNSLRHLLPAEKAGHTGTLDPDATGLLIVLTGRAVKAAEYMVLDTKSYSAVLRLGVVTDTQDMTGQIISSSKTLPSEERVLSVCQSFTGKIKQLPPMYSALKVGGRKLVDLARRGVIVEREEREVEITRLQAKRISPSEYSLEVDCSSGTYIRTLCHDIGAALGCGGAMQSLCRTKCGKYSLENAVTIEEIEKMAPNERASLLIPAETLFEALPRVTLDGFYLKLCRSGCEIYQAKIKTPYPTGQRVRLCDKDGFFALGEVREYEAGSAIKPIKLFRTEDKDERNT